MSKDAITFDGQPSIALMPGTRVIAGSPFTWWVGPDSRPADLAARLLAHGFIEAEAERAMALDLARLPATALTAAPLLDACVAGYRTATLQASAGGEPVYTWIGFLP